MPPGTFDGKLEVLEWDWMEPRTLKVLCSDGGTRWYRASELTIVKGTLRGLPRARGVRMGKTSLMGSIALAVKSGRAFRGR